jgi:hypothetical protein
MEATFKLSRCTVAHVSAWSVNAACQRGTPSTTGDNGGRVICKCANLEQTKTSAKGGCDLPVGILETRQRRSIDRLRIYVERGEVRWRFILCRTPYGPNPDKAIPITYGVENGERGHEPKTC